MSLFGIAAAQARQTRANNAEFEFQQHEKGKQTQKEFVQAAQTSIGAAGIIINDLEGKLAKARNNIALYMARTTALLGEVSALREEAESCPAVDHHILIKPTTEGRIGLDDIYDDLFTKKAKEPELDVPEDKIEKYTTGSSAPKY